MTELSCLPHSVGYEDEGVCLSIQIGPYSILFDCGLADITALRAKPADFAFCSHAHTDHMRGLLALHRTFPLLPIFASEVTTRLLPLNWPGQSDTDFCRSLPWRSPVEIAPGLSVQLWPAGHMPGAAAFLLTYQTPQRTYSVFYSGDCFLSNGRLVDGMPLAELRNLKPDVLIVEGSYGTERHPHRKQQENYLVERLSGALAHGGRAVFPSPLLGLGQELLMLMRSHHNFTGQPINVWVDPLIARGCDAYLGCLSALPTTVQNFAQHQPLFWDERVLPRVRRLEPQISPELLADEPEATVFIVHPATHPSAYGIASAVDWTVFVPDVESISLWQTQLSEQMYGAYHRFDWLAELAAVVDSEAVEHYMLTNHCDGVGTTQLIHNLRPQHVIFVHGDQRQLNSLASLDDLQARYHLHLPTPAQSIDLPLASAFWQPAPPQGTLYEGEIDIDRQGVQLRLPPLLESDPRWAQLSDTGIVEASWQGNQLVIRGLDQQELMRVKPAKAADPTRTCYYCRHLRGQRCRNVESPLVGLQVTSDGTCGVFERSAGGASRRSSTE
ncbi:MBL fold metallo-hydrolase [cf. Phormidesmis sp. LEGE 11477]|uniref:MBL fold metallo-hydrolase n=1 Tax=cf. Phormidesmis sp. LEGE 11477 TaxID=1828680 RepID=UPI0018828704|nr:MBL fold metallo-hydrolase [cf. Phormidesmis sp. LEGE 11477]